MPYLVLLASFSTQFFSDCNQIYFLCVCKKLGLVFDYDTIWFAHIKWDISMFNEIETFVPSLSLYLVFSSISQSWHERFLGTFKGFGGCQCCKWHWWYSPVQLLRLWYCWCSMGYNGFSGVLTENFNIDSFRPNIICNMFLLIHSQFSQADIN